MIIKKIIDSLPFQFLIGGLTVAGVSFSNHLTNTAILGVIASVPIGLPTAVFIRFQPKWIQYTFTYYDRYIFSNITILVSI